jgi:hypothetical protein
MRVRNKLLVLFVLGISVIFIVWFFYIITKLRLSGLEEIIQQMQGGF